MGSEGSYENLEMEDDENNQVTTTEEDDEVLISHTQQYGGSDEEWVRDVVMELLLWHQPIHTALWLVVLFLVFFLIRVSEYSLLTLICYLILLQLVGTTSAIRGAPMLTTVGLLPANFDPRVFALKRQAFSAEDLERFSRGSAEIVSSWILEWNETLETRNARKVIRTFTAGFWAAVIGLFVPLDFVLIGIILVAFTYPKIYELQQERIDELYETWHGRYEEYLHPLIRKTYPILDSLLFGLEPILGRFED